MCARLGSSPSLPAGPPSSLPHIPPPPPNPPPPPPPHPHPPHTRAHNPPPHTHTPASHTHLVHHVLSTGREDAGAGAADAAVDQHVVPAGGGGAGAGGQSGGRHRLVGRWQCRGSCEESQGTPSYHSTPYSTNPRSAQPLTRAGTRPGCTRRSARHSCTCGRWCRCRVSPRRPGCRPVSKYDAIARKVAMRAATRPRNGEGGRAHISSSSQAVRCLHGG